MKSDFIKKIICCIAITTSLVTILPLNLYAATWLNDNAGNYYFYESNNYAVGWRNIDGTVYYFDASGVMQKGWIQYGDSWYYLDNNGALRTGWINYNGEWYYSDSAGIMQTGILQINGQTYCFGNNGVMKKGSIIINGQFYTIGTNGAIISNMPPIPDKVFDSSNNCIQQINSTNTSAITAPNGSKFDNPIEDQSEIGDYEEPKEKFTVTFRDENGGELKKKTVKDGDTVKMYEPDDESDLDRDFVEWNTKKDGSGKSYDDNDKVKVTKDLTLYTIWEEKAEKTEVTAITISGESEVAIGGEIQLTADVKPSNATNTKVKWSIVSSTAADAGKATIDSNGVLKGVAEGKITVKAEASDGSGISATKNDITVVAANNKVTGITIETRDGSHVITSDGGKLEFVANVTPDNADNKNVRWEIVEGSQYAQIDAETGILTAYSNTPAGKFVKVKAVAKDGSGIESSNTIDVSISGQSIKASNIDIYGQGNASLVSPRDSIFMIAEVKPSGFDASDAEVSWTAEYIDPSITTSAEITGVSASEANEEDKKNFRYAKLTATQSGKVKVTVTITKNGVVSKNSTIITVNKEASNIDVTAKYEGGNTINIIRDEAGNDGFTIDLERGEHGDKNVLLKAVIYPSDSDTKSVTWSISDEDKKYAELDTRSGNNLALLKLKNDVGNLGENGKTITVTAKANDSSNIHKDIKVTIKNPKISATGITLSDSTGNIENGKVFNIIRGQSVTVDASITPSESTTKKVTWVNNLSSIYSNLISIDYSNTTSSQITITPKANKELPVECISIMFTAKADKAEEKHFIVNIYNNPENILFNYFGNSDTAISNNQKLIVGQTIKMKAYTIPTALNGANIKWTTDNHFIKTEANPTVSGNSSTISVTANQPGQGKCTATYTIMNKDDEPVFDPVTVSVSTKKVESDIFTILPKINTISVNIGEWNSTTKELALNTNVAVQLPTPVIETGYSSYNDWNQYKDMFTWRAAVLGTNKVTAKIENNEVILKRTGDISAEEAADAQVVLTLIPSDNSSPLALSTVTAGSIKVQNAVSAS